MVNMRSVGTGKSSVEDVVFPSIHPSEPDDLTFLDVLLIVTQRKKLVGIVTAICTAVALLLAFALPQEYTATVIILPPQGELFDELDAGQPVGGHGWRSERDGRQHARHEKRQRHVCLDVEEPLG